MTLKKKMCIRDRRGIDRRPVSLFTGVSNLPVLVTIVDQKENLEKLIPFLEKKATHALVLFEESTALVTEMCIRDRRSTVPGLGF